MSNENYKDKIKILSERLVEAQKPIRILDAIKWDRNIEKDFFAKGAKVLPKVDKAYYDGINLGFNPNDKTQELRQLINDIKLSLGDQDDLALLLKKMCEQYIDVVQMLEARGTQKFGEMSKRLYGSPKDRFFSDGGTILSQGKMLYEILSSLKSKTLGQEYPKNITSEDAVKILQERFSKGLLKDRIEIKLSDGIVADAAAGSDMIKIKTGTMLSSKDIDIFEVHEGWVHVATTANGKNQRYAKWLAKGPPRCTATQEGLAFLMEIITFSTYPRRARRVNDRILGVDKAEDGANFKELYEFYLNEDYEEHDAFQNSMRVFRGGLIEGGAPFTKDISYCRGFIENYNFIRTAIRDGRPELIPFLYVGKINVDDIPLLYQKYQEGIVDMPVYMPPQFADLNGLAVWMSFSNFLNTIDLKKVQEHYGSLFKKYL
jgi:uncharacterized protein (TIGR02421 family)